MKKVFATFLALLLATSLHAQLKLISFENEGHNFGKRKEEDGDLSHDFKFTNISDKPIKLVYVKASCGCTTPSWTQEIIQPGKTGIVTAKYGIRPGAFNKTVTVKAAPVDNVDESGNAKSDELTETKILRIEGDVAAKPKGISDYYPFEDGALRYTTNHVAFGNIAPGEVKTQKMKIYNQTDKNITLQSFEQKPYIATSLKPGTVIKAKDSLEVEVTYDATKVEDWDFVHDNVTINTDDTDRPQKRIYVSAKVQEDFSKMTPEQKANAAHIKWEKEEHDYGTINDKDAVTYNFKFTNTGKSDLIIRKVKASCGCTAPTPTKTTLKPGETSEVVVTFSPAGKSGQQQKSVTVVTNDPDKAVTNLVIKSNIQSSAAPATPGTPAPAAPGHEGHNH